MDGIEGLDKVSRVEHVSLEPPWRDALSLGAAGAQSAALVDPIHIPLYPRAWRSLNCGVGTRA